jgi:anion-transporting  ArsA/GET3 family ATPase
VTRSLEELLRRRLLIVTGKGGTGKTTLAATLATLAAARGIETVLVDLADGDGMRRLVCKQPEPLPAGDGRRPVPVSPHLSLLTIDPLISLTEYLELEMSLIRPLVRLIVRNPSFQRLLDAAPGWRDLITLGKLWHLATRENAPSLLVVDAPATGHGLSFLSIPGVVVEAVRLGPLRRHSEAVRAMLTDPSQTLVVPVTLAEELPVRETLELCRAVRALEVATGPTVVNGVESLPELPSLDELVTRLSAQPIPEELASLVAPDIVRAAIEHRTRRAALQRGFIEQLRVGLGTAVARLPYLAAGVEGPEAIALLADALETELR